MVGKWIDKSKIDLHISVEVLEDQIGANRSHLSSSSSSSFVLPPRSSPRQGQPPEDTARALEFEQYKTKSVLLAQAATIKV